MKKPPKQNKQQQKTLWFLFIYLFIKDSFKKLLFFFIKVKNPSVFKNHGISYLLTADTQIIFIS